MEYYFNNLDPVKFQRLINAVLSARFGIDARLTPLRGSDGGSDGETAPGNPNFEFQVETIVPMPTLFAPLRLGRYLFQVKHHRTVNKQLSAARQDVIGDFKEELEKNVLHRQGKERVNYFILVTNVPSSSSAKAALDKVRTDLLTGIPTLHADIWWEEHVIAHLDQLPSIWNAFPEMFAGNHPPIIASVAGLVNTGLPRAFRLALEHQYKRDSIIRFQQIDLTRDLSKLFVDLDVHIDEFGSEDQQQIAYADLQRREGLMQLGLPFETIYAMGVRFVSNHGGPLVSALSTLLSEQKCLQKIILEGGPGQGKSTLTQMTAQIYREQILGNKKTDPEGRWDEPEKARLPFRIELKEFADWLISHPDSSVEEFVSIVLKHDSGGTSVDVTDIQTIVERSPVLLIFDGLDEIGNDDIRNLVLTRIDECVNRFEQGLHSDLRVIVTTHTPAIVGRREKLPGFHRLPIAAMREELIDNYLDRWLLVHEQDEEERVRIRKSFERRRQESHVQALARNAMQLSVLLHFIKLKGEAFPNRRAELYGEYFDIVIDRDVAKNRQLSEQRELIEQLHQYLGYIIHALSEAKQADGSLQRSYLLQLIKKWLRSQGNDLATPGELFKLGEERLGLIVTVRGEGNDTWYGFAIQPIREYFAAAFINDQIEGNAHDVFEAMVRRPYWREVALFLAGLRRTNEKADLVSRARSLDTDIEWAWKQSGRALVFQLLQEGVFAQPRHVFVDALNFVFDLLDPRIVKAQTQPKDFIDILPGIIKEGRSEQQVERTRSLLHDFRNCNEEYTLSRIYRVASQLLPQSHVIDECMRYAGTIPDVLAKVRLLWPCVREFELANLSKDDAFWSAAPDHVMAYWWLYAGARSNTALTLNAPSRLHNVMLEQFAISIVPSALSSNIDWIMKQSVDKWVVWELVRLEHVLNMLTVFRPHYIREDSAGRIDAIISNFDNSLMFDYTGLDVGIQDTTRWVLTLVYDILNVIRTQRRDVNRELSKHAQTIMKYLSLSGIDGVLVVRFTSHLLRLAIVDKIGNEHIAYMSSDALKDSLVELQNEYPFWSSIIDSLLPFYGIPSDLQKDQMRHKLIRHIFISQSLPTCVRLTQNVNPSSFASLLTSFIREQKPLPFSWIPERRYTSDILRSLSKECSNHIEGLLVCLASFRIVPSRSAGCIFR